MMDILRTVIAIIFSFVAVLIFYEFTEALKGRKPCPLK